MKPSTAMILAAGLGTRLRPLTDTMPKALVPYNGVPMLETLILKLKEAGFHRIVINVHHFADMIEEFVAAKGNFGMEILFSDERDLLRDTGGGIRHARELLQDDNDAPILFHNVDIISDIDLNALCEECCSKENRDTEALLVATRRKSSRYLLFADDRLRGWIRPDTGETKGRYSDSYERMAFGGIHFISQSLLSLMDSWPDKFSIIDFYLSCADSHKIKACKSSMNAGITDIGKMESLFKSL